MDWHFSVNTRIAEASRGVVNRSWYISELEWIRYREGGAGPGHAANGAGASAAAAGGPDDASPAKRRRGPLDHVVPVPTDVAEAAATCPVCQERFDVSWHDETQTPVWTNAVRVGRKVFHKTCYDEVYGQPAAGAGPGRNSPSVLGKRKLDIGM
ncbi:MAG: hypothetical protein INR71_01925 [Terriglobus roseus]|nr:hypothetical protein [Terriglobus roseus]